MGSNFKPDPDFYLRRLEFINTYLSDERKKRSFPAKHSEARLRPVVDLQTQLYRYLEKRNRLIELHAITSLPSEVVARIGGRAVNVYVMNVGHFEGRYQYSSKTDTIYASVFDWPEIKIPFAR